MANVIPEVVLGMPFDVGAQKIDGTTLDTYGMVVVAFSVTDQANRVRFFEETFLVANVSPEVVLGMPFLTLSGADVDFLDRELRWRTYTIQEALPTTKRVELVGKEEFAAAALDPEHETFVVHVASLSSTPLTDADVHPSRRPQLAGLIPEGAPTMIPAMTVSMASTVTIAMSVSKARTVGMAMTRGFDRPDSDTPRLRRPFLTSGSADI